METIYDRNGVLITVGARVIETPPDTVGTVDGPDVEVGTVVELTPLDVDVNDHGSAHAIGPCVVVDYDDGTREKWLASWNATGPWDDHRTDYTCDDVEVAT